MNVSQDGKAGQQLAVALALSVASHFLLRARPKGRPEGGPKYRAGLGQRPEAEHYAEQRMGQELDPQQMEHPKEILADEDGDKGDEKAQGLEEEAEHSKHGVDGE